MDIFVPFVIDDNETDSEEIFYCRLCGEICDGKESFVEHTCPKMQEKFIRAKGRKKSKRLSSETNEKLSKRIETNQKLSKEPFAIQLEPYKTGTRLVKTFEIQSEPMVKTFEIQSEPKETEKSLKELFNVQSKPKETKTSQIEPLETQSKPSNVETSRIEPFKTQSKHTKAKTSEIDSLKTQSRPVKDQTNGIEPLKTQSKSTNAEISQIKDNIENDRESEVKNLSQNTRKRSSKAQTGKGRIANNSLKHKNNKNVESESLSKRTRKNKQGRASPNDINPNSEEKTIHSKEVKRDEHGKNENGTNKTITSQSEDQIDECLQSEIEDTEFCNEPEGIEPDSQLKHTNDEDVENMKGDNSINYESMQSHINEKSLNLQSRDETEMEVDVCQKKTCYKNSEKIKDVEPTESSENIGAVEPFNNLENINAIKSDRNLENINALKVCKDSGNSSSVTLGRNPEDTVTTSRDSENPNTLKSRRDSENSSSVKHSRNSENINTCTLKSGRDSENSISVTPDRNSEKIDAVKPCRNLENMNNKKPREIKDKIIEKAKSERSRNSFRLKKSKLCETCGFYVPEDHVCTVEVNIPETNLNEKVSGYYVIDSCQDNYDKNHDENQNSDKQFNGNIQTSPYVEEYNCIQCGHSFFRNSSWICEENVFNIGIQLYCFFHCEKCTLLLSIKDKLRHGVTTYNLNDFTPLISRTDNKLGCRICLIDVTSSERLSLLSHLLLHAKEMPQQCIICMQAMSTSRALKNHMRKHKVLITLTKFFYKVRPEINFKKTAEQMFPVGIANQHKKPEISKGIGYEIGQKNLEVTQIQQLDKNIVRTSPWQLEMTDDHTVRLNASPTSVRNISAKEYDLVSGSSNKSTKKRKLDNVDNSYMHGQKRNRMDSTQNKNIAFIPPFVDENYLLSETNAQYIYQERHSLDRDIPHQSEIVGIDDISDSTVERRNTVSPYEVQITQNGDLQDELFLNQDCTLNDFSLNTKGDNPHIPGNIGQMKRNTLSNNSTFPDTSRHRGKNKTRNCMSKSVDMSSGSSNVYNENSAKHTLVPYVDLNTLSCRRRSTISAKSGKNSQLPQSSNSYGNDMLGICQTSSCSGFFNDVSSPLLQVSQGGISKQRDLSQQSTSTRTPSHDFFGGDLTGQFSPASKLNQLSNAFQFINSNSQQDFSGQLISLSEDGNQTPSGITYVNIVSTQADMSGQVQCELTSGSDGSGQYVQIPINSQLSDSVSFADSLSMQLVDPTSAQLPSKIFADDASSEISESNIVNPMSEVCSETAPETLSQQQPSQSSDAMGNNMSSSQSSEVGKNNMSAETTVESSDDVVINLVIPDNLTEEEEIEFLAKYNTEEKAFDICSDHSSNGMDESLVETQDEETTTSIDSQRSDNTEIVANFDPTNNAENCMFVQEVEVSSEYVSRRVRPKRQTFPKKDVNTIKESKPKLDSAGHFKCDLCALSFKKLELLQKHKELHKKNPFVCWTCVITFSSANLYNAHMISVHSNQ